jgi:CRP-like cAMP-binding protein
MHDRELEERAEFLSSIPVFHTWTKHYLTQLAQIMAPKSVPRNKVIIRQGDEPDGLYFIKHGECKVVMQLAFRRRKPRVAPRLTSTTRRRGAAAAAAAADDRSRSGSQSGRNSAATSVAGASRQPSFEGTGGAGGATHTASAAATPAVSDEEDQPIMKLLEVGTIGPREYFGELALIETGSLRAASVISTTPVDLLVLSKNDFARRIAPAKKTFDLLVEASTRYASPQDLRDAYFKQKRWEEYKKKLVSDIVVDKEKRRALKYR